MDFLIKNSNHFHQHISGVFHGSDIYLYLFHMLGSHFDTKRVAFYHRKTEDSRKREILLDLQLPYNSESKTLLCVVSTVSLSTIPY